MHTLRPAAYALDGCKQHATARVEEGFTPSADVVLTS